MTSSLVGSEMCIRDSSKKSRCARPRGRCHWHRAAGGGHAPTAVPHTVGPVSYTHLTLPTICSV
eukprot:4034100-Prorocentrum_lima.AAC.1